MTELSDVDNQLNYSNSNIYGDSNKINHREDLQSLNSNNVQNTNEEDLA